MATITVILTSASTSPWVRPADFGALVSVEAIGGGASGGAVRGQANGAATGGGAGGYSKITTDTIGATVPFVIGAGGAARVVTTNVATAGAAGGNTTWNSGTCVAAGGSAGGAATNGTVAAAAGGTTAAGTGTVKFAGGSGATCTGNRRRSTGGGGAAGLNGNGNSSAAQAGNGATAGASGDAGSGGAGGTPANASSAGGNGAEYTTAGSGGGGAGWQAADGTTVTAGSGGNYGAGGGGASGGAATITSGAGRPGLIVIVYSQAVTQPLLGRMAAQTKVRLAPFRVALAAKLPFAAKSRVGPGMQLAVHDEVRTQLKTTAITSGVTSLAGRIGAQTKATGARTVVTALYGRVASQAMGAAAAPAVTTPLAGGAAMMAKLGPNLLGIGISVTISARIAFMAMAQAASGGVVSLTGAATVQAKGAGPVSRLILLAGGIAGQAKGMAAPFLSLAFGGRIAGQVQGRLSPFVSSVAIAARATLSTAARGLALVSPGTPLVGMITMMATASASVSRTSVLLGRIAGAAKASIYPRFVALVGSLAMASSGRGIVTPTYSATTEIGCVINGRARYAIIYGDACGC